ncbi:CACP acetyltransferase, partial [Alaudala cheleensis]|nr:CACP acetyltransferase [Alaudala cheleensis]
HAPSLAADVELFCFTYEGFAEGAGPRAEALVQVALQVAFYRAHGSLCATCEPLSLRRVLPGCTDLLRPPGPPCLALARALDDPDAQPQNHLGSLKIHLGTPKPHLGTPKYTWGPPKLTWGAPKSTWESQNSPGNSQTCGGVSGTFPGLTCRPPVPQVRSREGTWLLRGPLVPDGYGVGVGHLAPPPSTCPRDPSPSSGGLRVAVTAFTCCSDTGAAHLGGAIRGVFDRLGALLRGRSLT